MQKMSILATNGGLWGDFSLVFCIEIFATCPFHVWNKNNGRIMSKWANEYNTESLHIVYENNHFEPTDVHNEIADAVNVYNCNVNNQMNRKFITKK
jgi:hypothetical protein